MIGTIFGWMADFFSKPSIEEEKNTKPIDNYEYTNTDDPFYANSQKNPSFYCKCGQHYYSWDNYFAWIVCDANGIPIVKWLDSPGAQNIKVELLCIKGRGPEYDIHGECNHPNHWACRCAQETYFSRALDYHNEIEERARKSINER